MGVRESDKRLSLSITAVPVTCDGDTATVDPRDIVSVPVVSILSNRASSNPEAPARVMSLRVPEVVPLLKYSLPIAEPGAVGLDVTLVIRITPPPKPSPNATYELVVDITGAAKFPTLFTLARTVPAEFCHSCKFAV